MKRFLGALVVMALLSNQGSLVLADEKDATPILDKAITALGGEAKLAKAANATWKSKGTISFNGNENAIKTTTTVQGIDRQRGEFELDIDGNALKGVMILNVSKGWRKFNDDSQDLDDETIASAKQGAYLTALATTILPLKGKGFKVEVAPEEKVGDKTLAMIKGTGPDGKSFTVGFDKETGLPVKMTATVKGMGGEEFVQETTYSDYKEFDGIKRATKTQSKRDGSPFVKLEMSEFKVLDKPEAGTFDEPK